MTLQNRHSTPRGIFSIKTISSHSLLPSYFISRFEHLITRGSNTKTLNLVRRTYRINQQERIRSLCLYRKPDSRTTNDSTRVDKKSRLVKNPHPQKIRVRGSDGERLHIVDTFTTGLPVPPFLSNHRFGCLLLNITSKLQLSRTKQKKQI